MSLLAARPHTERASVALPTVKCSSCSDSIPLSSLGEHICRPSGRSAPRPSQIVIPTPSASSWSSQHVSSSYDHHPPRPAFAGPSSARSSPSSTHSQLTIPDLPGSGRSSPNPAKLSPMSMSSALMPGRSPSPRTPSPTNPFFPSIPEEGKNGPIQYGLGLAVAHRPEGPFPTDAPLPAGISDLSNMSGGGNAGMAGVGRRAFQAAAWGVTAGISMANSVRQRTDPEPQPHPQPLRTVPAPSASGPSFAPGPRSAGAQQATLPPWQQPRTAEPTPREPHIPPRAPLSGRSRSGTMSNGSAAPISDALRPAHPPRSASAMDRPLNGAMAPPPRSTSALSHRQPEPTHSRAKESVSSVASSRSSYDRNDSVSQLLKGRAGERKGSNDKQAFFDKYKEMQRSNSKNDGQVLLGIGGSRKNSMDDKDRPLMDSPQQTTIDLGDDEDEGSALPWATPALRDSPDIGQGPIDSSREKRNRKRYPTANSEISSSSSGSSRSRALTSGAESEEVVTPSQSYEGFTTTRRDLQPLKDIHEIDEDEGDRVIFGALSLATDNARSRSRSGGIPHSESNSTLASKSTYTTHTRSRTTPANSGRRVKTCQKCGEHVGGTRKFVERDGVVLCEADWKKMYLPTCRRCSKLIENKMVSADDGQLKGKWHSACFTCTRCDEPFEGKDFYVHAGRPWCQYHYAEETGTLCASSTCRRPIEGACILTQGSNPQRYHPGHLQCEHRGCRDTMEEYYDVQDKKYCERHVAEGMRIGQLGDGRDLRAEKRKTRLVDLPRGGF